MIYFTILGKPVPKARPRVNKKTGAIYTPSRTKEYEKKIREEVKEKIPKPFKAPIYLKISFYFHAPQKKDPYAPHDTRPDLDNLIKSVMDALNGVVYYDDSQVAGIEAGKYFLPDYLQERTVIGIDILKLEDDKDPRL